eukprot:131842-Alexandrium_andersonii.AAC.1
MPAAAAAEGHPYDSQMTGSQPPDSHGFPSYQAPVEAPIDGEPLGEGEAEESLEEALEKVLQAEGPNHKNKAPEAPEETTKDEVLYTAIESGN